MTSPSPIKVDTVTMKDNGSDSGTNGPTSSFGPPALSITDESVSRCSWFLLAFNLTEAKANTDAKSPAPPLGCFNKLPYELRGQIWDEVHFNRQSEFNGKLCYVLPLEKEPYWIKKEPGTINGQPGQVEVVQSPDRAIWSLASTCKSIRAETRALCSKGVVLEIHLNGHTMDFPRLLGRLSNVINEYTIQGFDGLHLQVGLGEAFGGHAHRVLELLEYGKYLKELEIRILYSEVADQVDLRLCNWMAEVICTIKFPKKIDFHCSWCDGCVAPSHPHPSVLWEHPFPTQDMVCVLIDLSIGTCNPR